MNYDLILLGNGPSKDGCPFDSEVWAALSVLGNKGWEDKPYSKAFCFDIPEYKADEMAGLKVAQARGIPIVSGRGLPCATEYYPAKKITERFESFFFHNDMSYMLAMALYKGYKSLSLWGVDQGPDALHRAHRKYVTFWLGVATGMGVQWKLAPNSLLWERGWEVDDFGFASCAITDIQSGMVTDG